MPMTKQARQIWTEKLGLVHPLPYSGVIFREIGHLATIPIFLVRIIKQEWTPKIYKIKLYRIVIILYRMHTKKPKKNIPLLKQLQSAWRYYCFPCAQNHAAVTKIPSRQINATDRDSRADRTAPMHLKEISPPQYHIYILIIHSGPVARTVPIKNHGQDSSTSQLESIGFK